MLPNYQMLWTSNIVWGSRCIESVATMARTRATLKRQTTTAHARSKAAVTSRQTGKAATGADIRQARVEAPGL